MKQCGTVDRLASTAHVLPELARRITLNIAAGPREVPVTTKTSLGVRPSQKALLLATESARVEAAAAVLRRRVPNQTDKWYEDEANYYLGCNQPARSHVEAEIVGAADHAAARIRAGLL